MNKLRQMWRDWQRVRQTERELYGLSDRELSDLGINRSDIPRIAARAKK